MADHFGIMLDGIGPAQKIALNLVDGFTSQELELGGAFDTFRDDRQAEAVRQAYRGRTMAAD